jgi:hypothetical protein
MRTLKIPFVALFGYAIVSVSFPVSAQDNNAPPPNAAAPAAGASDAAAAPSATPSPTPAPEQKKKGGGPSLSLSPEAPQVGGIVSTPTEQATTVVEEPATSEWKFDVTGYFRAPMRMSWGPAVTTDNACQNPTPGGPPICSPGTQLRTPPFVPDANYIDWKYTNSLVGPWTELNFHYGNDRVKATVQIASYNITDPGYRRLEANLGINQAFLTVTYPELGSEDLHLTLTVGGFTNRYGAAGRYDAGKYETYLFGRTHVAGETANLAYDWEDWTFQFEEGFGGKLETIPFFAEPGQAGSTNPNASLPVWEPYPGPRAMESTFVAHAHLGAVWKKQLILGLHLIDTFANGNELSTSYTMSTFNDRPFMAGGSTVPAEGRPSSDSTPRILIYGADAKFLNQAFGDGYVGYSHLDARNAIYLQDAIEVLHSFGGWQLHDNYFGAPGNVDPVTGTIDSIEFQYVFSFGAFFHYPQAFWGDGPDLIASVFGMYNHINAPMNPAYTMSKLKYGGELTYIPLSWMGLGFRFDHVSPDRSDTTQDFTVFSPRLVLRTAFVTHEQILFQYSRYFYGDNAAHGMFPYNSQAGAANISNGADKNAFQIAAIIWF